MKSEQQTRAFSTRAFVALMICFSGLGLPVTGIANHIYGFSPPTFERHAWMSAHNALGILFVVFSIWHVLLNSRALWSHMRSAAGRLPAISREALLAGAFVALALLVFAGHAFHGGR
jgi:hypothetical protein